MGLIVVQREVREPYGECALCERIFYDKRSYDRHFQRNAKKHAELAEEFRMEKLEERLPIFQPWDPEVAEHMAKVGERMKREGRLTVHKSERAGF